MNDTEITTMEACPFCVTRKALQTAREALENTPEIGADLFDDTIAELINDLDCAHSLFECYCDDKER